MTQSKALENSAEPVPVLGSTEQAAVQKARKCYGTQEWSTKSVNCCTGCSHGCRYCYAMGLAIRRKQVTTREEWLNQRIRRKDVAKRRPLYKIKGRVMFPSTHDITPTNLEACLTVLKKLLVAGNQVLVVSKPHLECIQQICSCLEPYKEQVLFRFTIGAMDNAILSFWEPGAPSYEERKASLEHAFHAGYQTSVSAEPMLDSPRIDDLVADLLPFVTDALWIGTMNHLKSMMDNSDPEVVSAVKAIEAGQAEGVLRAIYDRHGNNPKIKWKSHIKRVLGLPLSTEPGMDV